MNPTNHPPRMGILNFSKGEEKFLLSRIAPSQDLSSFVKHYWIVSWDLSDQKAYWQDVVPNPSVNIVFEKNKTEIYGIRKVKSSQQLIGTGKVFGIKFKPGGFYPFIKSPVSGLSKSSILFKDVFGVDASEIERSIFAQNEETKMVEMVESLIRRNLPEPDMKIIVVNQIIDRIREDLEITKVDDVCQRFSIGTRKLQRLFDRYVGVSPKWVIKLYRLQHAAEQMEEEKMADLSQLPMNLGYYDQAHFIKDFKSFIGKTPQEYIKGIR